MYNNEEDSILEKTLITNEQKYEIKVKEIYNGTFKEAEMVAININISLLDEIEEYTIKFGTKWREFIEGNFSPGEYGNTGLYYVIGTRGEIYLGLRYSTTAGQRACLLEYESGDAVNADEVIKSGNYVAKNEILID